MTVSGGQLDGDGQRTDEKKEGKTKSDYLPHVHARESAMGDWFGLTGSAVRIGVPGLFANYEGAFRYQTANDSGYFTAHRDGEKVNTNNHRQVFYGEVTSRRESRNTYFWRW